jgi:hypothetical protein
MVALSSFQFTIDKRRDQLLWCSGVQEVVVGPT